MFLLLFLSIVFLAFSIFFLLWGLSLALLLGSLFFLFLISLLAFSDRILLHSAKAKSLHSYHPLLSKIHSVAFQSAMERPLVYESSCFPHSLFYFEAGSGQKYLLVGTEFTKNLSPEEVEGLLVLAFQRLKRAMGRRKFLTLFLLSLGTLPAWGDYGPKVNLFFDFILIPLRYLIRRLALHTRELSTCDDEAKEKLQSAHVLAAALQKLSQSYVQKYGRGLALELLPYFSLAGHEEKAFSKQVLGDAQKTKWRIERLLQGTGKAS